jgi:hypothetical protein
MDDISLLEIYIGAVLYTNELRKIVLHDELKEIKGLIGDAYNFSVKSADLLFKKSQISSLAMPTFPGNLYEKIVKAGKFVISVCLAMIPENLGRKFILKFPKTEGWDFSQEVSAAGKYWEFVKKILRCMADDKINLPILMRE